MAHAASTQYIDELHKHWHYWATWSPGTPLALGTVGEFQDGVFIPTSSLASFGIRFRITRDKTPQVFNHQSEGSVDIAFKAKGETKGVFKSLSKLDVGLGVDFTSAYAVCFQTSDCYEDRIVDVEKLKRDVHNLSAEAWPPNCAVITHLQRAESATILISGSAGSRVELKANADIGQNVVNIADVLVHSKLSYLSKMNTQIVASQGLTPLFRAIWRIHHLPWEPDEVGFASDLGEDVWEEVEYADVFP